MKKELDEKLCETYPAIFADRRGDKRKTCMVWGFACGDGWYDLIERLCAVIQNHHENYPDVPQTVAAQVKEKFGGLRFYVDGGDEYIHGAIAMAETMSFRICEECGKPGDRVGGGWIRTLCDEHKEAQEKRNAERRARQEAQRVQFVKEYGDPEEAE